MSDNISLLEGDAEYLLINSIDDVSNFCCKFVNDEKFKKKELCIFFNGVLFTKEYIGNKHIDILYSILQIIHHYPNYGIMIFYYKEHKLDRKIRRLAKEVL